MRKLFVGAIALASLALFTAAPANAYWKCMGGYVACGSSSSKSYKKTSYRNKTRKYRAARKSYGRKARYVQRKRTRRTAKRTYSGAGSMSGIASYYWQPQAVASGGRFNPNALTAAHKTLPFGTKVRVTHAGTGRSVVVTINDRGPYVKGRIIDLSRRAAQVIGMTGSGIARVRVNIVG